MKVLFFVMILGVKFSNIVRSKETLERIDVVDMTKPTTWTDMSMYYGAMEKHW